MTTTLVPSALEGMVVLQPVIPAKLVLDSDRGARIQPVGSLGA